MDRNSQRLYYNINNTTQRTDPKKVKYPLVLIITLFCMFCSSLKLQHQHPAKILSCKAGHETLYNAIYSMKYGATLATQQDSLMNMIIKGEKIEKNITDSLKKNPWIKAAAIICPSNLVIRQWCLIDVIEKKPSHREKIRNMMKLLSDDGNLWAEGYSYWKYTRSFVSQWLRRFEDEEIQCITGEIDRAFALTSYKATDCQRPAPYGDLRNECMDSPVDSTIDGRITFIDVKRGKDTTVYRILGRAKGLNTHVPIDASEVQIINGKVVNYKYYEGYEKKYTSKEQETLDVLHPARVKSALELLQYR